MESFSSTSLLAVFPIVTAQAFPLSDIHAPNTSKIIVQSLKLRKLPCPMKGALNSHTYPADMTVQLRMQLGRGYALAHSRIRRKRPPRKRSLPTLQQSHHGMRCRNQALKNSIKASGFSKISCTGSTVHDFIPVHNTKVLFRKKSKKVSQHRPHGYHSIIILSLKN